MRSPRRTRPWHVAMGVLIAALAAAAPATAAPPVISGSDGDRWSTDPTYTVTAGTPVVARARFSWSASSGETGSSEVVPFTVVLDGELFDEGPGSLTVTQRRGGLIERSTRAFVIDRTPPDVVTLSVPATAAAGTEIPVSWSAGEDGAHYTLRVRTTAGALVQGPSDTTATSARIVPLEPGSYVVGVVQSDAAGNTGAEAVAAMSIPAALVPAFVPPVVPSAAAPGPSVIPLRLPSKDAGRLRPRRASRLTARRPILRWARGPAGTRLYNVQLFRVFPTQLTATGGPRLRKVMSRFPRIQRMRAPTLSRGVCYVWRVWPYGQSGFTEEPLGLSNFCVKARAAS